MKILSAFFLVMAVGALAAADLTTKSGTIYKDFSIIGVTHRGVTVEFADGVVNVPPAELPDNLQEKYAAEVESLREKHEKKTQARREREHIEKALKKLSLDVIWIKCSQILKGRGVLATCHGYTNSIFLDGLDTSSLVDGVRIPAMTNIKCDGEIRKGHRIYFVGTYSYKSAGGVVNTIPYFTFDKNKALSYAKAHPGAMIVGMVKDRSFEIEMQRIEWEHRRRTEQMRQQNVRTMQRQQRLQNRGRLP